MAKYANRELSTRNRMETLKEALNYFEEIGDTESYNEVLEIISKKENKKNTSTKKEKSETPKKKKVSKKVVTEEDIEQYDPDDIYVDESGNIKSNLLGLGKISKNIVQQAVTMQDNEIRSCVDFYYQNQTYRIATENQLRSIRQGYDVNEKENNISLMEWNVMQLRNIEENNKMMLVKVSDNKTITRWLKSIVGIGPVISTVLYAYLNVDHATSAGNFWSYAGLNDNNNPWLGTTKAGQIVNDIWNIRKIIHKAFKKAIDKDIDLSGIATKFYFDEEEIYRYISSKVFSPSEMDQIIYDARMKAEEDLNEYKQFNQMDESILTEEEFDSIEEEMLRKEIHDTTIGTVNLKENFTVAHLVDYVIHLDDNNICTSLAMQYLYVKLNYRRKINNMINSATIRKEDDQYFGLITKKSLTKYLAKPPYNRKLKVLMWKIGESFVKVSNKPNSLYGALYKERKAYEIENNKKLLYKDQCAKALRFNSYNKNTVTYQSYVNGMLPDKQINERAKRWTVKIFLSHLFEAMYIDKYGMMPQTPYPISRLGHVDYIEPEVPYSRFWDYTPYDPNKIR